MICIRCKQPIPDGSAFCNHCGKKQTVYRSKRVRGNGMGCAYKRGRTWTACVTVGWATPDDPGKPSKPIRKTKGGFASKKDAIAYCPVLLAGGAVRKEVPRLSDYWDTYSQGQMLKLGKNTQSAYRTAWKKLTPVHFVRVDCVTVDLLQHTIDETCHSYDTAADCKSLLVNLFRIAGAEQTANGTLPSYITLPDHAESERIPFNKEEQALIWKAYDNGDRRAAMHLLMIYTGMMPGEAQKLKVSNIDLGKRIIVRAGMKTAVRKQTPIVLADCILPVVQDLIDNAQQSGYIWVQDKKKWYGDYYAVLEETGCRRLSPYSCRHTTATALSVDAQIAPQTIRKIMRWSTVRMLDRYAHPDTEDALEAINKLK